MTESPLFAYPNVVVTPHLGASTAEATDRAGFQAAEQVVAALTGGSVTTAVNVPAVAAEDLEVLGPFLPLCRRLGRLAAVIGQNGSIDRIEVEYLGRLADRDCRPLTTAVLLGVLSGHTEDEVNAVNAPGIAAERGIVVSETTRTSARDFTELVRVTVVSGGKPARVVGTTLGRRNRPHLLEVWGRRFNLQLEDHMALFRYEDRPGDHRPRRHDVRRARRQHRRRRGRLRAGRGHRRVDGRGRDGRHDARRDSGRAGRRRSPPPAASRRGAPSAWPDAAVQRGPPPARQSGACGPTGRGP